MLKRHHMTDPELHSIPLDRPSAELMRYYDLTKNWRKVKPHLADKKLNHIMRRDFQKYVTGRWGKIFLPGQFPRNFEASDWWTERKGRRPQWWNFVSHGACHWLVNTALRMAILAEPYRPWRIITSDKHSTVWDGETTLFEFNFQAFGTPADECFAAATETDANPRELNPGEERKVGYPEHYSVEQNRRLELVAANDIGPPVAVAA
jgi:hypothetical protein